MVTLVALSQLVLSLPVCKESRMNELKGVTMTRISKSGSKDI